MRARILVCVCAFWIGGCLYPEYGTKHDGGTAGAGGSGTTGAGGRGGSAAGAAGVGGPGGSAVGVAGSGGGVAGSTAGRGGAAGSVGGVGSPGSGGTPGAGGASAGRGGTTGAAGSTSGSAGSSGGSGGRGGTSGSAGTGGGSAGRGGTGGTAGSTAGTGGGAAGRGGSSGTGGSGGTFSTGGAGGSTVAPSWVSSLSVVYQFDSPDIETLGLPESGGAALQLGTRGGSIVPYPDDQMNFIEGSSARLRNVGGPAYFVNQATGLPSVFQTADASTSFTMGGWFRIDSSLTSGQQYLMSDDGPNGSTSYQGGFIFNLDQQSGMFGNNAALAYCRIGFSDTNGSDWNEVSTPNNIGPDTAVGAAKRWTHLVCRYDAANHTLAIFVGGALDMQVPTSNPIQSGPGPFMIGCDQSWCQLLGNVDEVFFTRSALSTNDIKRIYACGIDGSRCRCNGTSYLSCGFAQSCTSGLPTNCNQMTP